MGLPAENAVAPHSPPGVAEHFLKNGIGPVKADHGDGEFFLRKKIHDHVDGVFSQPLRYGPAAESLHPLVPLQLDGRHDDILPAHGYLAVVPHVKAFFEVGVDLCPESRLTEVPDQRLGALVERPVGQDRREDGTSGKVGIPVPRDASALFRHLFRLLQHLIHDRPVHLSVGLEMGYLEMGA